MTEKKQNILQAALDLFAAKGFSATTTAEIARRAGVSEGLIFRHFRNKRGLLDALLDWSRDYWTARYGKILDISLSPRTLLRRILSLPFAMEQDDKKFWRFYLSLIWQREEAFPSPAEPLRGKLEHLFTVLGYEDATAEAQTVMMILYGAATTLLTGDRPNPQIYLQCLLEKYDLD